MYRVGIWERDEGITATVRTGLRASGTEEPELITGDHPARWADTPLDLLVLSPGATGWAGASVLQARAVLIPGGLGPMARSFHTRCAVSYGTSPKDSLTLSSLEGPQICVAVQRELVTVGGAVVERQELVMPFPQGLSPRPWLAAVGTLLLLGVPPEAMEKANNRK
ncbi:MAG: hypothetical protein EOM52_09225 [Clostridia bacterium]|nr:hypothetical protein [Clostridia bacterium]